MLIPYLNKDRQRHNATEGLHRLQYMQHPLQVSYIHTVLRTHSSSSHFTRYFLDPHGSQASGHHSALVHFCHVPNCCVRCRELVGLNVTMSPQCIQDVISGLVATEGALNGHTHLYIDGRTGRCKKRKYIKEYSFDLN